MGKRVLSIAGDEADGRAVRSYAHCLARVPAKDEPNGGIALAVINLQNVSAEVSINTGMQQGSRSSAMAMREVYHLGTVEGVFTGHRATLNGEELVVAAAAGGGPGVLPSLAPKVEPAGAALALAPLSVAYVVLPHAKAEACL